MVEQREIAEVKAAIPVMEQIAALKAENETLREDNKVLQTEACRAWGLLKETAERAGGDRVVARQLCRLAGLFLHRGIGSRHLRAEKVVQQRLGIKHPRLLGKVKPAADRQAMATIQCHGGAEAAHLSTPGRAAGQWDFTQGAMSGCSTAR